jgi:hypothetical protein
MSQVPPSIPPSVPPSDRTSGQQQPQRPSQAELESFFAPEPRKTNVLAVTSLICGILACVPFLTGIAAIITGVMGMRKANDPRYGGRGIAIAGLVLGVLSVLLWATSGGGFWALFKATEAPRALAATFVRDVSAGDLDTAMASAGPLVTPAELRELNEMMQEWGAFQELTSANTSIQTRPGVTQCELSGTAEFTQATRAFEMTLIKQGDEWKVAGVRFP